PVASVGTKGCIQVRGRRFARDQNPYRLVWAASDAAVWAIAIWGARWLRYDFEPHHLITWPTVFVGIAAGLVHLLFGFLIGPYSIGHLRASFEEVVDLTKAVLMTMVVLIIPVILANPMLVPRSVPITGGALALLTMFSMRLAVRTWRINRRRTDGKRRVIVFGAGEGGRLLLRTLTHDGTSPFAPVALLDDSPLKQRLSIEGVSVRGTRDDLEAVAAGMRAETLAIAVPSADSALIRDLTDRATACGLATLVLPSARELMGGLSSTDLRDVNMADLLGRRPIRLDTTAIAESISGKRILVTGAGGSIGSELCHQISRFGPERLVMLDRDESALQAVQLLIDGNGLLESDDVVLADIRDLSAVQAVFAQVKPDMVFHTAALKHLPLLESYPREAWRSNVIGTLNILRASRDAGVGTVVNISTDKAADPTSALGYSKRLAERLTADFARKSDGHFVSVRFGNVLGSRGSVIHAFTAQIEQGGPVTVTHPDVERFFMLVPEACQLVLQASTIGSDGEVMVLDMGEPVKIIDVARTLIRLDGRPTDIVFTGLRPGEKLDEVLFSDTEHPTPTAHPLVSSVHVKALDRAVVESADVVDHATAKAWMRAHTTRPADAENRNADLAVMELDDADLADAGWTDQGVA
ncbi:nucleoside-diphosphate sugar epimerase/dehydratase, partial [Lapillicoccus sp.]|uniref:polysaccharide biosynthesis protein n=1 Tax=Lapillicoccus sp. TaxID=1909287 RepID=UPI003262D358